MKRKAILQGLSWAAPAGRGDDGCFSPLAASVAKAGSRSACPRSSKSLGLVVVLAGALLPGCSKIETAPAANEAKSSEPESRVHRGTNGETQITLDAATQKLMGLETVPLAATERAPGVKGFGRVLDPAPLAELLMELGKAQLVFDNAHQELERMKVLRKDNNTSERAFQASESTYRQNGADVGAVWFKIQRAYGNRMAELTGPMVVPPGTLRKPNPLLSDLAEGRGAFLVRVDVPGSESLPSAPSGARIAGLGGADDPVRAAFFGDVPTVDAQTQSRGYFFLVTTNQSRLTPGMAVTAFIQTEGPAQSGVVVSRNAVVRFNGATWVYLQTGDDQFQREEIALETPVEGGWFVREGLKPQDKVVTVGAQQLLSEELKAQISGD